MKERVYENSYSAQNQEQWYNFFTDLAQEKVIFAGIRELITRREKKTASNVGKLWFEFSEYMPFFLTRAASQLETNEQRAYITQVAYEELGYGNPEKMHYLDFEKALIDAGVDKNASEAVGCKDLLSKLSENLEHKTDDAGVLGLCLGLEIIANENIDCLFESLAYSDESRKSLSASTFFKIHRVNEDDHIALNVANFMRFCDSEEKKKNFIYAFKEATSFWTQFWNRATERNL